MKKLGTFLVIAVAAIGLSAAGCKKKSENAGGGSGTAAAGSGTAAAGSGTAAAGSGTAAAGSGTAAAGSGSGTAAVDPNAGSGAAPAVAADYLKVIGDHVDASKGKVEVTFAKWSVTKASFDPANLEGGTAELSIDPTSLSSGIPDRDAHLQSPDFLDVGKFATVTVKVDNVKKAGDKSYTADATLNLHGVEKKLAITFEAVASTADSVTVKTSVPFNRIDFQVAGVQDKVKPELTLEAVLTLKKS